METSDESRVCSVDFACCLQSGSTKNDRRACMRVELDRNLTTKTRVHSRLWWKNSARKASCGYRSDHKRSYRWPQGDVHEGTSQPLRTVVVSKHHTLEIYLPA